MTRSQGIILASLTTLAAAAMANADYINEWNLIVRNDLHSTSETDASALIGGSIFGASNYSTHFVSASNGDGLAVGGDISAASTVNINNAGNLRISGSVIGTANLNGGTQINDAGVASLVTNAFNEAQSLSNYYLGLTPNGTLDGAGNLSASPTLIGSDLVSVYSFNQSAFQSLGQLNLSIGANETVILNVGADGSGIVDLIAPPNLIGDFSQANSSRILWNFYDATQVKVNNSFNGSLLATNADLQLFGGGINGSVIVDNVSVMNAEIRQSLFNGHVPEPTSLLTLGLGAMVLLSGRRNRA